MWLLTITPALRKLRQRMASWRPALIVQQDSTLKENQTRSATNCVPQGVLYFLFLEITDRWTKTIWEQKLLCPFAGSEAGDRHWLQPFGKVCLHQKSGKGEAGEPFSVQSGMAADTQVGDTTACCLALWRLVEFLFSPSQSFQHSSRKMQRWGHLQRTTALSVSARLAWLRNTRVMHSQAFSRNVQACGEGGEARSRALRKKSTWGEPCDGASYAGTAGGSSRGLTGSSES